MLEKGYLINKIYSAKFRVIQVLAIEIQKQICYIVQKVTLVKSLKKFNITNVTLLKFRKLENYC